MLDSLKFESVDYGAVTLLNTFLPEGLSVDVTITALSLAKV